MDRDFPTSPLSQMGGLAMHAPASDALRAPGQGSAQPPLSGDRMFNGDLIIARARGALFHLAEAYLTSLGEAAGQSVDDSWFTPAVASLAGRFGEVGPLWRYCHSQAVEGAFCEHLQRQFALDPTNPPILAELTPDLAQRVRASQSRFLHSQRMLALDPEGLPPIERRLALMTFRRLAAETGSEADEAAHAVEAATRDRQLSVRRDEVLQEAIASLPSTSWAQIDRSGISLFVSGLAEATGRDRVEAVALLEQAAIPVLREAMQRAGVDDDVAVGSMLLIHPQLDPMDLSGPPNS